MTYDYGTTATSGGRWGVAVKHAVRPDSIRVHKGHIRSKRAISLCGAQVFPFIGQPFEPDGSKYVCKRCAAAAAKEKDTPQMKAILRQNRSARVVRKKFPVGSRVTSGAAEGTVLRHVPNANAQGGYLSVRWDNGTTGRHGAITLKLVDE